MSTNFYNSFHTKNKKVQQKKIDSKNYTYQGIIRMVNKYFLEKGKVADFGCGVGTIDFYLSSRMKNIVGFDISPAAVKKANESAKKMNIMNTTFVVKDLKDGHFSKPECYDYVICSEVFEHIEDDEKLLHEIFHSMKKGAFGIFSVPSLNAPLFRWGKLEKFDQEVGHVRRYSTTTFKELIKTKDFDILDIVETEGLLRNLLYTNNKLGFLLKFIRWPLTFPVNFIDNIFVKLFGESNIFMVVKK